MRISGVGGLLRVGFQTAAWLGAWTLVRDEAADVVRVTAACHEWNDYWLAQRPIALRLQMPNRVWHWADVTALSQAQDGALSLEMHGAPQVI